MLVVERAKALALKLNNPAKILESIPTAKPLEVRGVPIVVTPHRLDEVRVLRNLGIRAPSPILHYYNWPGRFTPFEHQRQTAAFLTLNHRCLVLNEIGTGKTQSALWAADYLIKTRKVKKVLIMSPLSTLERVWGDGIFTGLKEARGEVLAWSHADLQTDPADVFRALDLYRRMPDPQRLLVKGIRHGRRLSERVVSWGMKVAALVLLRRWMTEINAQPKLFHRDLLERISHPPVDFNFDVYVLYRARRFGWRFAGVHVRFPPRQYGQSNWAATWRSKVRTILRSIRFMFRLGAGLWP